MALTGMDSVVVAMAGAQRIALQKASATTAAGFYYTLWNAAGMPAAGSLTIGNITAGVIPTDATVGAPIINAFTGSNTGYALSWDCTTAQPGIVSLYDRVYHAGSFSTTTLHTDTLSGQPTLTRVPGNDYSQLEIWLELNAVMGATATTVTISYQDGNNTTQTATLDSNLSSCPINRMLPFRPANGTGIQKLNSVTVGGVLGTGTFNIVVQRNICDMTVVTANISRPRQNYLDLCTPIIYTDSCLALMYNATTTSSGTLFGEIVIGNA